MKRNVLFIATLISVLLTGTTLAQMGRTGARSHHSPGGQHVQSRRQALAEDRLTSPEALRWRQGLPTHWRACLLQR